MKRYMGYLPTIFLLTCFLFSVSSAQKVETLDGIRTVHNSKKGLWGKDSKVALELIQTIGDVESLDEHVSFYMPTDITFDDLGNFYIMDSGNHRIQKFSPDGKYLATLGRKGQGPGEFNYPQSLDIDADGNLYITDMGSRRVQVLKPDGTELKTIKIENESPSAARLAEKGKIYMAVGGGMMTFSMRNPEEKQELSKVIWKLNKDGSKAVEFGEKYDYDDPIVNRSGNRFHFTTDKDNFVYIAFDTQNRIEKFSSDGKLMWKADRELDYYTGPPKEKAEVKRDGGRISLREPQINRCSSGIAVDDKGRVWVATLKRQLKEDETVQTNAQVTMSGGARTMALSVGGNTDVRETDIYRLDIYAQDGVLLGSLPLTHFVDDIHIHKGKLYILDKMRGMQYFEYQIKEK